MFGYEDFHVSVHSPDISRSKAFVFTYVYCVTYNDTDSYGIDSYVVCNLTTMQLFPVSVLSKLAFVQRNFLFRNNAFPW